MRPCGGFMMPSQGRPGVIVQRTTEMKVCLQNQVFLFPSLNTSPVTRHVTTMALHCESHSPKQTLLLHPDTLVLVLVFVTSNTVSE